MFVTRKRFDGAVADATLWKDRAGLLERQAAILEQHVAWLTQQLNRAEGERSIFLQRLLGVQIAAPVVTATPSGRPSDASAGAGVPLNDDAREPVAGIDTGALMLGAAAFEDMGDEEAERLGIGKSEVAVALR